MSIFFILPLLLVFQMSASNWKLLQGNKGLNLPANYTSITSNHLFWPAVVFTIEYTVVVTVLLIGLGLGLALLVQTAGAGSRALGPSFLLPVAVGLAAASLLFWGFYSPTIGPISPPLQQLGLIDHPIQFFADHVERAALDRLPDRVEVRRLLHADPAGRPAGHPAGAVRGGRDRRRRAAGRPSGRSRCRCCARRWPSR